MFPDDDHNNRSIWRIYLPHVRQVLESDLISNNEEKRMDLMWRYGRCLYSDGRWDEAEASFIQVLAMEMRTLGADSRSTLTSMANLALTYRNQGRWKKAEQLEVQVMEMSKTKLGADHPDTLTSMNNLAFTWKELGRDAEAMQLIRYCVRRQTCILGATHPQSLSSYKALSKWEAKRLDTSTEVATKEDVT
jgi:tetratricopeptide (TPR) repeat protein